MKKALLLINDKNDISFMEMLTVFKKLFKGFMDIHFFENCERLSLGYLSNYALVVTYDNINLQNSSAKFASVFISYVANGGGWLALHRGTLVNDSTGLTTLLGVRKISQLPKQIYNFVITSPEHSAMADINAFEVETEIFQYEFSTIRPGKFQAKRALLFEYLHNMTVGTGGWAQEFCLGRVVGIGLCSNLKCFKNQQFYNIVKQCGLWAAKET